MLIQILQRLQNPNRGMNRNDINRIKKIKYKRPENVKKGEEDKCPICISEYQEDEELR